MASRIRDDLESLKARAARPSASGVGQQAFVATVVDVDDPASGRTFHMVSPVVVYGEEVEGGDFDSLAQQDDVTVPACNLGAGTPTLGALVLVFSVPNRLVFFT